MPRTPSARARAGSGGCARATARQPPPARQPGDAGLRPRRKRGPEAARGQVWTVPRAASSEARGPARSSGHPPQCGWVGGVRTFRWQASGRIGCSQCARSCRPRTRHTLSSGMFPIQSRGPIRRWSRSGRLNRGETRRLESMPPGTVTGWDAAGVVRQQVADGIGPADGARVVGFTPVTVQMHTRHTGRGVHARVAWRALLRRRGTWPCLARLAAPESVDRITPAGRDRASVGRALVDGFKRACLRFIRERPQRRNRVSRHLDFRCRSQPLGGGA
jgi:hypothetical protein